MIFARTIIVLLLLAFQVAQAGAQMPDNCALTAVSDPDRYVLSCAGNLVIEMDAATKMGIVTNRDGHAERVTLTQGTILIDVEPGGAAPQIRTPHAIAAVRGTVYALDIQSESTAVFVLRGVVNVRHLRGSGGSVDLGAGQGVDVAPGQALEVKTWGDSRVRELLSRFGR
ncbi:FecR family protein [Sedimentitalea sp. JM2-8]|uniref:FecR family protein n=1 Tax=Sedimentitalea xiamensis TaxID=3050037 RepID=A0ABT7FGW7_9RHOB|nr:FecR family protein [Sedimentitalea xiamensis]MDK3074323.1 FecR family protein [Sedimentitalea xiamensis]